MAKDDWVYVSSMGMLYKLSPGQWKRWLTARSIGNDPDLSDYGLPVSGSVENVTDLSAEEAQRKLHHIIAKEQKSKES